jgi:hypothetical protein
VHWSPEVELLEPELEEFEPLEELEDPGHWVICQLQPAAEESVIHVQPA